jgi:MFS family permease
VRQKKGIFYGWWVLIACAIIQFYFAGTFVTGFTALFNPIATEFGWSYAIISLATTFTGFQAGFMAPIVGFFVDRLRPQKLLFAGIILGALAFFFLSHIQALWTFYISFMLLGVSLSMSSQVVVLTAVTEWFKKNTVLAMGILTAGSGAGGLLAPVLVWFVDNLGWRRAVEIFGLGALVICIPLCFLVKDPPREAGDVPQSRVASAPKPAAGRIKIREILSKRNFWVLSLTILFAGFATQAVTAHQIPYLMSIGINRETAGFMVLIFSISNIAGRLGFGWLGDRMDKRYCFILTSLIQAGGLAAFTYATSAAQILPALLILGLGLGGIMPLRPALQIEFFGRNAFAIIQGLLFVTITIGGMAAPPFAGWVFDFFKSYRPAWLAFTAVTLLAIPMVLTAPKYEAVDRAV